MPHWSGYMSSIIDRGAYVYISRWRPCSWPCLPASSSCLHGPGRHVPSFLSSTRIVSWAAVLLHLEGWHPKRRTSNWPVLVSTPCPSAYALDICWTSANLLCKHVCCNHSKVLTTWQGFTWHSCSSSKVCQRKCLCDCIQDLSSKDSNNKWLWLT